MEQLKTTDGTGWELNKSGVPTDLSVDGDMWCDHCFVSLVDQGELVLGGQRYSRRTCPTPGLDHNKLIWLGVVE